MPDKPDGPSALMLIMHHATGITSSIPYGYEVARLSRVPGSAVIEFNPAKGPESFTLRNLTRMTDEINHMFGPGTARLAKSEDYANPELLQSRIGIVIPNKMLEIGKHPVSTAGAVTSGCQAYGSSVRPPVPRQEIVEL